MIIRGYDVPTRLLFAVLGAILLVIAIVLFVQSCDKRKNQAAQGRVERSQAEAASNSAADAINAVTGVGTNEAASSDLGRQNEREIRNAQGAGDKVGAGVNAAGLKALCKRAAYRNDPKCKGGAR